LLALADSATVRKKTINAVVEATATISSHQSSYKRLANDIGVLSLKRESWSLKVFRANGDLSNLGLREKTHEEGS
jgi:hypothetical protein